MERIELPAERRVGHLKLLREPRRISSREFNALSADERLDLVRRLSGRAKYNLLIEAADAENLVQRMSVQEIYLLSKELGEEDSGELVLMLAPEQFTPLLDLDCWQGDRFDEILALTWLGLLLEGGDEKVVTTLRSLDFDLLLLLTRKQIRVVAGPEDIHDDDARIECMQRDGGFVVEYREDESGKLFRHLLDILFRMDVAFYGQLLEAVRWTQESILEEEVYQLRCGRLLDNGFPDPFAALAVYAWLDPGAFAPEQRRKTEIPNLENIEPPGFYLTAARPKDLLAEVLAGGIRSEVAWELTYLVNKVISADRVDFGDPGQVQNVAESVYRYLNLALEHLSEGNPARAAELFDGIYLEYLFRLGFSLTLDCQRRAQRIQRAPIGPYLDGPFRALVAALLKKKPCFYEGLAEESRAGERPFACLHDLRLSEDWLQQLEVQLDLFDGRLGFVLPAPADLDLTGCFPSDTDDLTLSDFFLTALANRLLGGDFQPQPIAESELAGLHGLVCREGKLAAELRRETMTWLEGIAPGAGDFGGYCLDLWEEVFASLAPADIDPRYGCGLIVRA